MVFSRSVWCLRRIRHAPRKVAGTGRRYVSATGSSAGVSQLREQLVNTVAKLDELEKTEQETLEAMGDWSGPRIKVRLTADETRVTSSTDVICKDQFKNSLFRELVEKWVNKHLNKDGEEETKIEEGEFMADQTIDLWFDRDGFALPIIIRVMQGYDCSDLSFTKHQRKLIAADCEFYRVPSVITALFGETQAVSDGPRSFDVSKMKTASHSYIESSNILKRTGNNGKWECTGITNAFSFGTHSILLQIKKSAHGYQMFGVIPVSDFAEDGYFGYPLKGIGYYAWSGKIYGASTIIPFAESSKAGDKIGIRVSIPDDKSASTITFTKNGNELGTKDLSKYCSMDGPLIFAVCSYNVGDEIQIL